MIDGRHIANGCHDSAPPPEPTVAVNSRQLASAASHELHDSQDIFFFCQLSVGLVPLILQMEGNRPKGITAVLKAPVGLAGGSLGPLSSQLVNHESALPLYTGQYSPWPLPISPGAVATPTGQP